MVSTKGGKLRQAHVVTWEIVNGRPLPQGKIIRHTCDTPACVNPAHLLVGTHADNVADKVSRMRQSFGETHGLTALSGADVDEIKERYNSGEYQKDLAAEFGVSQSTISHIVNGVTWKFH